ncbi:CGA synthase-related protein [Streptomyces sp. NPDC046215]|uniref:CGA synthase-related protein n=1 Tax=Streptomyces stramineus TaxID=173861 RepID=A0ABN1AI64_9ACTN
MAVLTPATVLLASRDEQLDSLLARRRVAAHLGGLRTAGALPGPPSGVSPRDVALVCDDTDATARLLDLGVPVVHLRSGHGPGAGPDGALCRVHRPGWLPGPPPSGERATGTLAPARLTRNRARAGTLLLLSAWDVPEDEADAFAAGPLRPLAAEAVRRTGRCAVVCDTRLAPVRAALDGLDGVRVTRAAETDADALHAGADVFLAAPTMGALTLAQARRSPLVFLPPLGAAQRDLARQVAGVSPVATAHDPADPALWAPPGPPGPPPWSTLDPAADDLRGAQRVARTLRQLSLAPL